MEIKTDTALNCLDTLKKLNDLLVIISQSIRDKNTLPEEIETCIGIAWDLGNSVANAINGDIVKTKES